MPPIQFTQQPLAMHNMPQADVVIIGLFNWLEQLNTNNAVSVICLQETWLSSESSTSLYDLPNYQLISRGKYCSNHGGLITYVHNDYNWEPLNVKDQTTG